MNRQIHSAAPPTRKPESGGKKRRGADLIFAPVHGIAFATVIIAVWRVATRRFGFPTQPGHWLLIIFGVMMAVSVVRIQLQSVITRDNAELLPTAVASCSLMVVAYMNRDRLRWSIAFSLLAVGFGTTFLAFLLRSLSPSIQPVNLLGLGLVSLGSFPFLLVICTAFDLAERGRYDIFHWIGIATIRSFVAHFIALSTLPGLVR